MDKGLVIETSKNFIIVISEKGDCLKLKHKTGVHVSQEIYYTENDIYKERPNYRVYSGVAAVFVLCFAMASLFYMNGPSRSYGQEWLVVSVDINPSMEFSLDDNDIVRTATPLNPDAEGLSDDDWTGEPFDAVLAKYFGSAAKAGYLHEGSPVLLGYYAKDESFDGSAFKNRVSNVLDSSGVPKTSLVLVETSEEELRLARKEKMSLGRIAAYGALKEETGQTLEEFRNQEISKFMERVGNTDDPKAEVAPDTGNPENGDVKEQAPPADNENQAAPSGPPTPAENPGGGPEQKPPAENDAPKSKAGENLPKK